MLGVTNLTMLKFICVSLLALVVANGESAGHESCPLFCKDPLLNKAESDLCVGKCRPGYESSVEKCIQDCTNKNPEAPNLCDFNCKLQNKDIKVADKKESVQKDEDKKLPIDDTLSIDESMNLSSTVMNVNSYMNNLLNHMMDGVQHQKQFGWLGNSDPFRKVFKNFGSIFKPTEKKVESGKDEKKGVKMDESMEEGMKEVSLGGEDLELKGRILGGDSVDEKAAVNRDKEGVEGAEEQVLPDSSMPIMHRFIIIKRIPLFTFFNQGPKQEATDVLPSNKEVKADNSDQKLFSFFSMRSHKPGHCVWKRPIMVLLLVILTIFSTWYCMARLIAYRTRWIQDSVMREATDDFEYLIPIDEKMIFLKSDEKLPIMENTLLPPPYKPAPSPQNPIHEV